MSDVIIAPSILSANFARLGDDVRAVLSAGADWIHFDVMDNHYVPNLTFGPMVLKALRADEIASPIDVHLMVEPVDALIESFIEAGANSITFHPEASRHVHRSLALIKSAGVKGGLALNPATPLSALDHVWEMVDLVLIMSVNPGFGGQAFIPEVLPKIGAVRKQLDLRNRRAKIAVDGGISPENVGAVIEEGANIIIAGSAIFSSQDYRATIKALRENAVKD